MKNNNNARTEGLTDEVCWHSKHLKLNLNGTNVNVDASHIHTHTQAPVKLTGMVPINSQNHIISVMCLLLACVVVKVMQWGGGGGINYSPPGSENHFNPTASRLLTCWL